MTNYARRERQLLTDLLLSTGPDAPTLCAGWTTRDLAAHVVVRERRPDSGLGILIKPLAGYADRIRVARAALPYPELIAQLRNPPVWSPMSNPLVDPLANTMEMFIHLEDVRRGGDTWEPRSLEKEFEAKLWSNIKLISRVGLRRLGITAEIEPTGFPAVRTGDEPQVRITGDVGEIAVFFFGRQRASRVTVEGSPELVERLRTARLGI